MQSSRIAVLFSASVTMCCDSHPDIQCETTSDCNLHFGGVCTTAPTGNQWCSYPDPSCPSGMRYSDRQVGDGVSGQCVTAMTDAGGVQPEPASCIALPHTCGLMRRDDCCNSPMVVGGDYFRSFDLVGDSASGNMDAPATISNFRLDKYEVTVGRFRAFVEAGQGTQLNPPATGSGANPYVPGSGWEVSWNQFLPANKAALIANLKQCPLNNGSAYITWTDTPGADENLPINCVGWYTAMAFCAWDGGFLPTEAEWNYAAAGGSEQRAYPWSSPSSSTTLDITYASYNCLADEAPNCAFADILPVGMKPKGDGRWGQSDLAGNLMEWILDWDEQYPNPCIDCAYLGPHPNGERVLRGGQWYTYPIQYLRAGTRTSAPDGEIGFDRGFRCGRAP